MKGFSGRGEGFKQDWEEDTKEFLARRHFSLQALVSDFEEEKKNEYGPSFLDTASHQTRRELRLQELEEHILDMQRIEKNIVMPAYVEDLPFHEEILHFIESAGFQIYIFILVIVFAITMGAEMELDGEDWKNFWFMVDCFFALNFCAEVILKLYSFGHAYFGVPWFALEFITTGATMLNLMIHYRGMAETYEISTTIVKCSRIILLSKLFSMREEFQIIVLGFTRSIISLSGVFFVLFAICYAASLFCFIVIGKNEGYKDRTFDYFEHEEFFGTIARTMVTMFSVLIVSEWPGIVRAILKVQPMVVWFFVLFSVMVTFGILNVVTGIIVDTVNNLTKEHQELKIEKAKFYQREKLQEVVDLVFHMGNGHEISEEDFFNHANANELFDMISDIDFPHEFSLRDLFTLLDTSGHKMIVKEQFVDGMMRLIYGNDFHRDCQTLLSINKVRRDLIIVRQELRAFHLRQIQTTRQSELDFAGAVDMPALSFGEILPSGSPAPLPSGSPAPRVPSTMDTDDEEPLSARSQLGFIASYNQQVPSSADTEARSEKLLKLKQSAWDRLRATIHTAAVQECREELNKSWEDLEKSYAKMDPSAIPRKGVMPTATIAGASYSAREEEAFFVRNKLCSAVLRQSLQDVESGLDHARALGISDSHLSIVLTYRDTLRRHRQTEGFDATEIVQELEANNWSNALDMTIEVALSQGADKNMVMSGLTRLCADSAAPSSWRMNAAFDELEGRPGGNKDVRADARQELATKIERDRMDSSQEPNGETIDEYGDKRSPYKGATARGDAMKAALKPGDVFLEGEVRGRLVAVLHTEATQHAAAELQAAWEKLDRAYRSQESERLRDTGGFKGGFNPEYSPFSKQEEQFFMRNQINNAVLHENLSELRRALTHAIALGVDPRSIEIEIAYRDALMKYRQGVGFNPEQVTDALDRGDWWTALDDIVSVSFAAGADKHILLKALARVCTTSTAI